MSLSKSSGYLMRIFCAEYDLEEMILAYGIAQMRVRLEECYDRLEHGQRYSKRHHDAKRTIALKNKFDDTNDNAENHAHEGE